MTPIATSSRTRDNQTVAEHWFVATVPMTATARNGLHCFCFLDAVSLLRNFTSC